VAAFIVLSVIPLGTMIGQTVDLFNPIKGINAFQQTTTLNKLEETYALAEEIILNLDELALGELMGGNSDDIDKLYDALLSEIYEVLYGKEGRTIEESNLQFLPHLTASVEENLRITNLNYFATSVLPNFQMNWHHVEWGNLVMKYKKLAIIAARDHGKCVACNTLIRMYDGSLKRADNIQVGDKLMGIDSTPREVLNVHFGSDKMYTVHQKRALSYTVNSRHTMHYRCKGKTCNIDMNEWLNKSDYYRSTCYGYRVGYELQEKHVKIDPYFMGLWLGDGNSDSQYITNTDKEVIVYLHNYAKQLGLVCNNHDNTDVWSISDEKRQSNCLRNWLKEYGIIGNKHLPIDYLQNSKSIRLSVLAGLVDSDGNLHEGCYYIGQKSERLAKDIQQLAYSLGYRCSISVKNEQIQWLKSEDKNYTTYECCITGDIHEIPVKIVRKKKYQRFDSRKDFQNSSLSVEEAGYGKYVGFEVDKDHLFLLEDGTVLHNSYFLSHLVPVWKMYRYTSQKNLMSTHTNSRAVDLALCERGFIITNEMELAKDLLEIVKGTIEENPILYERLFPTNKDNWSTIKIKCKNGARLALKSYGSSFRGRHPHYILVDDFLKDNVLYSELQRKKATDYFHSVIMNAIVPGGQVILAGTPFHEADLYGDLKESMKRSMNSNDPEIRKRSWMVFEYPSVYPNGTVLWETRYPLGDLLQKREDQGNLRFSREHLVRPIVSDSSIFPYDILKNAILGMEKYNLVNSRENFPIKFNRVLTACDFAMSSSVGADYSAFGTFGVDDMNRLWLLNLWRDKGKSYGEQLAKMKSINANFRPDIMILEANQFQTIFVEGAMDSGLPVIPHHTGTNKYNLEEGLPSVALLFEHNRVKFPRGDQYSRDMTDIMMSELAAVTWTDKGKLEGVGEHDDTAMMLWLAKVGTSLISSGFSFGFLG